MATVPTPNGAPGRGRNHHDWVLLRWRRRQLSALCVLDRTLLIDSLIKHEPCLYLRRTHAILNIHVRLTNCVRWKRYGRLALDSPYPAMPWSFCNERPILRASAWISTCLITLAKVPNLWACKCCAALVAALIILKYPASLAQDEYTDFRERVL